METVQSLIENYMNLTGRPMATLSVEEYLAFTSFASSSKASVFCCTENTQPMMVQATMPNSKTSDSHTDKNIVEALPEKKENKLIDIKSKHKEEKEEKTDNTDLILKMLKSVPG